MDDPWGSPWATADGETATTSSPPKPPSPSKAQQLELPRPTFAKLPSFTTHSPWGDEEDGFGDWASADPVTTTATNGWGGWAGENASNSSQQLTPMPRDEVLDKGGPIAWPGSIATSPNFNVKPVSRRASSVFRQPSPDPWAAEFSLNETPTAPTEKVEDAHTTETSAPTIDEHEEGLGLHEVKTSGDVSTKPSPPTVERVEEEGLNGHDWRLDAAQNSRPGDVDTDPAAARKVPEITAITSSTAHSITSRPSSPDSDDSHHHEDRQDSPITSVDEDSRLRPQVPRKVSNKVQELVERYDALAKPVEEAPIARQERSRSRTPGPDMRLDGIDIKGDDDEVEDEDADFGDFEDAIARLSRRPSTQEVTAVSSDETPVSHSPSTTSPPEDIPLPQSRPTTSSESQLRPRLPNLQQLIDKFGPIKFEINNQDVDKLFDSSRLSTTPVLDSDSYVPDYIVNDSFTDISERKTWYRISRQGTMRKHNLGNDENYKRVAWSNSTARMDTIKIVRRWMEEDSFSGRPTLGGSSSKGHGFGWDSGAEPVTLDQVFRKKRSNAHTKSASAHQIRPPTIPSLQSPSQPMSPDMSSKTPLPSGHQAEMRSPIANFGWSAAPAMAQSPTLSTAPATPSARASIDTNRQAPAVPAASQFRPAVQMPRPLSMPLPAEKHLPATTQASGLQEDDDDEWGDMVASPADDQRQPSMSFEAVTQQTPNVLKSNDAWSLNSPRVSADILPHNPKNEISRTTQPETKQTLNSTNSMFSWDMNAVDGNSSSMGNTQHADTPQDPWGFGDLSAFDAIKSSKPEEVTLPHMEETTSCTAAATHGPPQRLSSEQSNTMSSLARVPSLPSQNDNDETLAVRRILETLPDLSYMLR